MRGSGLGRAAAALYLGLLILLIMTAWGDPAGAAGSATVGMGGVHVAFLMATGAATAFVTLARQESADGAARGDMPASGLNDLLAQMSHELRTPLNAVIGFSDVMLNELHGPLGARYQEYAHHISESGGRLLKSSEDTLAVAQAMTVLLSERPRRTRERVLAGPLVREAWRAALAGTKSVPAPQLSVITCATCEIACDRAGTTQALEHLLREAMARAPAGGTVEVKGRRRGGARSILVRVGGVPGAMDDDCARAPSLASQPARQAGDYPVSTAGGLRVILARLLLGVQGATLACEAGEDGSWSALIEFGTA